MKSEYKEQTAKEKRVCENCLIKVIQVVKNVPVNSNPDHYKNMILKALEGYRTQQRTA